MNGWMTAVNVSEFTHEYIDVGGGRMCYTAACAWVSACCIYEMVHIASRKCYIPLHVRLVLSQVATLGAQRLVLEPWESLLLKFIIACIHSEERSQSWKPLNCTDIKVQKWWYYVRIVHDCNRRSRGEYTYTCTHILYTYIRAYSPCQDRRELIHYNMLLLSTANCVCDFFYLCWHLNGLTVLCREEQLSTIVHLMLYSYLHTHTRQYTHTHTHTTRIPPPLYSLVHSEH